MNKVGLLQDQYDGLDSRLSQMFVLLTGISDTIHKSERGGGCTGGGVKVGEDLHNVAYDCQKCCDRSVSEMDAFDHEQVCGGLWPRHEVKYRHWLRGHQASWCGEKLIRAHLDPWLDICRVWNICGRSRLGWKEQLWLVVGIHVQKSYWRFRDRMRTGQHASQHHE